MARLFTTGIDLGSLGQALNFALEQLPSDPGSPRTARLWWLNGTGPRVYDGSVKHTLAYIDTSLSAFSAPTGDLSMGTHKITNVVDPGSPQDAATKAYVDANVQAWTWKNPCAAATTAEIALTGTLTIDGISSDGVRILVKNQVTHPEQNGVYIGNPAGAWTLAPDWDAVGEVKNGTVVPVASGGSTNADTLWMMVTPGVITPGVTPISFTAIPTGGAYSATNIGGGTCSVFSGMSGNQFQFNTISSANNAITLSTVTNVITLTFNVGNVDKNSLGGTALTIVNGGTGSSSISAGFVTTNGTSFGSVATINLSTDMSGWLAVSMGGSISKLPAIACEIANIDITAPGATMDGVSLSLDNRVLLVGQNNLYENGPWLWKGAAVPLVRPADYAHGATNQATYGTQVEVLFGTLRTGYKYYISSTAAITIDTTNTTWSAVPFNVNSINGIVPVAHGGTGASTAATARGNLGAMGRYATSFGDGVNTSYAIVHSLGTLDVIVQIYVVATGVQIECDVTHTDTNTVTLDFAAVVTTNQYRVVIVG